MPEFPNKIGAVFELVKIDTSAKSMERQFGRRHSKYSTGLSARGRNF